MRVTAYEAGVGWSNGSGKKSKAFEGKIHENSIEMGLSKNAATSKMVRYHHCSLIHVKVQQLGLYCPISERSKWRSMEKCCMYFFKVIHHLEMGQLACIILYR